MASKCTQRNSKLVALRPLLVLHLLLAGDDGSSVSLLSLSLTPTLSLSLDVPSLSVQHVSPKTTLSSLSLTLEESGFFFSDKYQAQTHKGNSAAQLVLTRPNCNLHIFLLPCFAAFPLLLYFSDVQKIRGALNVRRSFKQALEKPQRHEKTLQYLSPYSAFFFH